MNRSFGYYYAVTKNEMEKSTLLCCFISVDICLHAYELPTCDRYMHKISG